jgi:SAM-dependent methyltransferase
MSDTTIKEQVRARYAEAARQAQAGGDGCCGPAGAGGCCGGTDAGAPVGSEAFGGREYGAEQLATLPEAAVAASLGCGNPTALVELRPGQTVLDLARANAARAGVTNVEFLKGEMEAIPLPDASVDVIISNCVVNLSPDKGAVLREAYRVLRPGGRLAISDIVTQGAAIPAALRADMASWTGCVAGALEEGDYRARLLAAGFVAPEIVVTRVYDERDAAMAGGRGGAAAYGRLLADGGRVVSAFVRATRPEAGASHPARPADSPS